MVNTSTSIEYQVLDVIRNRRSIRAYSETPVASEKINSLFEAARWAPSSVNEQPWFYIYATKQDQFDLWQQLFEVMNESNRVWAVNAPLLVASFARKHFTRNGNPNLTAQYDLGQANAFLSLQAVELGLQVHQIGGYDREKLMKQLNVPNHVLPGPMMTVGYPGDIGTLDEMLQQRERSPRVRIIQKDYIRNQSF